MNTWGCPACHQPLARTDATAVKAHLMAHSAVDVMWIGAVVVWQRLRRWAGLTPARRTR